MTKANQTSSVQPRVSCAFIHVSDLKNSVVFYSMIFGLPVLKERLNGGPVYGVDIEGGTGLLLDDNSVNKQHPDWDESQQNLCMVETKDIEAAYEHVKNLEAEIVSEPENPHPGLAFFRFRDPDGNVLMVTQSDYEGEPLAREEKTPIHNRIKAIFINVTDMERAVKWYEGLFSVSMAQNHNAPVLNIPTEGGSDLLLDANRFLQGDDYKTLLMLDTDDVDEAYRFLKSRDVEIFKEIERYDDVSFFTFKDPDGNVLMVCQEHKK
ncbi:MAG TPA: VOC family protein [Bacillales bacterium]|nr:VOC family protein [Bacillales bacterium]